MVSRTSEDAKEIRDQLTVVRQRPGVDISLTGFIYSGIMIFMGVAATQNRANLLFGIFGLMIGVLAVSGIISRMVVKRLNVRRVLPEHGVVGTTLRTVYEITNAKRFWPSLSVTLAELDGVEGFTAQPQCYLLHAAAGMTASVPSDFNPKRRGLHELNRYQFGTGFPFGFVKRAIIQSHPDRILIYPALAEVDPRLLAMCRAAELSGSTVRPQAGGSDEFYGVKEFRSGENPRFIYWRRSARTGLLVSREMTKVAPPQLLLLVDSWLEADTIAAAATVERTIAMAASLASAALAEGLSVGLIAWSGHWLAISPARGKQQRTELLTALARLTLNRDKQLQELLDQAPRLLRVGVTPVLLTPRDVQLGLIEESRGAMLVISAVSPMASNWFRFDQSVNFRNCMPRAFSFDS